MAGDQRGDGAAAVRCWQCDAEPELVEITTASEAQPRYVPGRWPPGDHAHAVEPPTPGELEQAGHQALMRIRHAAA